MTLDVLAAVDEGTHINYCHKKQRITFQKNLKTPKITIAALELGQLSARSTNFP